MARSPKTNKRKQAQAARATNPTPQQQATTSRRSLLRTGGLTLLGTAVLAGGGVWAVGSFNRSVDERDLTRIGQGVPTVVQIHDPQCPVCNALQRETRKALRGMAEAAPLYLVADITQPEGAMFAQRHRVQHVTLLVFDGAGARVETLTGSRTRTELAPVFARYAR